MEKNRNQRTGVKCGSLRDGKDPLRVAFLMDRAFMSLSIVCFLRRITLFSSSSNPINPSSLSILSRSWAGLLHRYYKDDPLAINPPSLSGFKDESIFCFTEEVQKKKER